MKRAHLLITLCLLSVLTACSVNKQLKPKTDLVQTIDKNFQDASAQYKVMMKNLPPDRFPKTYFPATDKFETSGSGWWCSGFYPGTLLYLYEQTRDLRFLKKNNIIKPLTIWDS